MDNDIGRSRPIILGLIALINGLTVLLLIGISCFFIVKHLVAPESTVIIDCGDERGPAELFQYLAGVAETNKSDGYPHCAAAILHDEWILSRKKCFDDYGYNPTNSKAFFNMRERTETSRDIEDTVVLSLGPNDPTALVLLRISPPLKLHEPGVLPICLPPRSGDISDKPSTALGWLIVEDGDTIQKRPDAVKMQTHQRDTCKKMFGAGNYSRSMCTTMNLDVPKKCPVDKSSMMVMIGGDKRKYVVGLSGRKDDRCNHAEYVDVTQYTPMIIDALNRTAF